MIFLSKTKRDYYDILGIQRDTDKKGIKKAFRKLARKYHPDMNPDDPSTEEKFKEVAEAFEVLSDDEKKSLYDRYGHDGLSGASFRDFSGFSFDDLFGGMGIFDNLFNMFGSGSRSRSSRPQARRGQDVRLNLEISFEEAMNGLHKKIKVPNWAQCPTCHGKRVKEGETLEKCSTCNGVGEVRQVQRSAFGQMINITTCPRCRGEGEKVRKGTECDTCAGEGKVKQFRTVDARIPAGVDNGNRIVIQGEGRPGELGGPPGDLYVVIIVPPHPFFQRNGSDILLEYPISFLDAVLGAKLSIPTINGEEKITIKPGTESGSIITLRNKGAPDPNSGRKGDMHIGISVKFPPKIKKRIKERLEKLKGEIEPKYVFKDHPDLLEFIQSKK